MSNTTPAYTMTPQEMSSALNEMQLEMATKTLEIGKETVAKLQALADSLVLDPNYSSAAKQAITSMIGAISSTTNFMLPDIIRSLTPTAPLVIPTP